MKSNDILHPVRAPMKKIHKPWFSPSMEGFKADLAEASFSIFEPLADHGYFTWVAGTQYRRLRSIKDSSAFTNRIILNGLPNKLVPYDELKFPLQLKSLPAHGFYTIFPHAGFLAASLHVASQHRGVALDSIDFVLGGASLEVLATRVNPRTAQVVFRVPSSSGKIIVGMQNNRKYLQDYASPGFQFERFVTGRKYIPTAPVEFSNHIHEMKIDSHRVLLVNQIDAFFDGEPVEIKTSPANRRDMQVLFQLIGSGSQWLCQAEKYKEFVLSAKLIHVSEVMYRALVNKDHSRFEDNLLESLSELQDLMSKTKENELFNLIFKDGKMELHQNTSDAVFPPSHVVADLLLKSPNDRTASAEACKGFCTSLFNFLEGLAAIKELLSSAEERDVFDLTFVGGKVQLNRNDPATVFPRAKIVTKLLKSSRDRGQN